MSTWRAFYAGRKYKYRTKFPFLRDDQITAKLKRVWNKERRFSNCTPTGGSGGTCGRYKLGSGSTGIKEKPAKPVLSSTAGETHQEIVSPHNTLSSSSSSKSSPFSSEPSSSHSSLSSASLLSPSHSHQCHRSPWKLAASTALQPLTKSSTNPISTARDSTQDNLSTSNPKVNTSPGSMTEDFSPEEDTTRQDFLCDMFPPLTTTIGVRVDPLANSIHLPSEKRELQSMAYGESSYCLFLNEADIFM